MSYILGEPVTKDNAAPRLAFALYCLEKAPKEHQNTQKRTDFEREAACAVSAVFTYLEDNKARLP